MDFKDLRQVLSITKNEIYIIIFYSMVIGLLSLVLPIAAQGLVTIVSFGSLRQPLFILVFAVFVLLIAAAIFRLLQNVLLEIFQQRVFAVSALNIANRLPKLKLYKIKDYQPTELLNRFFDVVTIQKCLADILLNFTSIILQSILGMILLAFYHPALLVFDIFYIFFLVLVVWLPFKPAMQTAYIESDAKYDVVSWLEEMVRVPFLFHFQGAGEFGVKKADQYVATYIKARKQHFYFLLQHLCTSYVIQIFGSTALLLVGGLLVLKNQMTLGQLVAAEIIVTSLGNSTIKLTGFLQKTYDMVAAAKKVNSLLTLPIESHDKTLDKDIIVSKPFNEAPVININNLDIIDTDKSTKTVSLVIEPRQNIVFMGYKQKVANNLVGSMLGLREPNHIEVKYNNIPVQYYSLKAFREMICYINHPEIFNGTIMENILVGRKDISLARIMEIVKHLDFEETINKLEDKLEHHIGGMQHSLSNIDLLKVCLIRACISHPSLLVIDGSLDILASHDIKIILPYLCRADKSWTLIATTNRAEIAEYFDKRIAL